MAAVQALDRCFDNSSENIEYSSLADSFVVLFALLSKFSGFCLLHSLDEVSEELVRILLPAELELDGEMNTFLKILLRFLSMLLGEKHRPCRVLL